MPDLSGESFGRYHILEQLGEGGMATVYKAYDTRLETEVAVKVIRTENILPSVLDRALKRFEREAKALARLTHPNIVKVTDYGEYEGKPYLVMPYLPGGTLKQKLGKPIPWQEALQILLPIAEALDYAHSQNMIHRDVKPSNILLTERGQPMLTDFGIAKVLDLEETQDLTGTSAAVGTPEYMAPEQATAKTVDHRADIYALGVVLYEMVTGRKPFIADTPMAVLIKHATEPLPRPKQFASNLPEAVEKVLLKALAKDPANRYLSMAEIGGAFTGLLRAGARKSTARPRTEPRAAQSAARKAAFAEWTGYLKSLLAKPLTLLGVFGSFVILFGVLFIGLWVRPKLSPISPPIIPSVTLSPTPGMTNSSTPSPAPTTALTQTPSGPFEYTLQEGDSLADLAKRFDLGPDGVMLLLDYNPSIMENNGVYFVGQTLKIPLPGTLLATPTPIPADLPRGAKIEYKVLPGDTLAGIAAKFNSRQEDIITANPEVAGHVNNLVVGETLQIPVNLVTATATLPVTSTPIIPATLGIHSEEITDAAGVQMVLVPAGEFIMGSDAGHDIEKPAHTVYLDAFYMDKYEVTNALYKACVDAGTCPLPHFTSQLNSQSYADYPVVSVDWSQAKSYCEFRGARLPTEAEWEKAARGTDGRMYPWGEGIDCSFANHKYECYVGAVVEVGLYEKGKSPYGIYDMASNAWEWVADWFDDTYYASLGQNVINPLGPSTGAERVLRGGGWSYLSDGVPTWDRLRSKPSYGASTFGIRCAKDATP